MILFDNKEILFELMDKFETANIGELTLKAGDFEISMKKSTNSNPIITEPLIRNENIIKSVTNTEEARPVLNEDERIIKAPIIGTYYSAPSPGAEEFIFVGKKVRKGDILCIISAMKVMNEIESEYDGEITEIYCSNDSTVEYGADLFKLKTN